MPNEVITDITRPKRWPGAVAILALVLALVAVVVSVTRSPTEVRKDESSTLQRVTASRTLRVGYEGYPPYTIKNPATGQLTGLSVDLAEYIAREAGWKVQWVQTSPDTKIPDLQAGRFDVMTEPIFQTIPRAMQVTFTRPYAYFGDAAGIVRKGDRRFKAVDDLNKAGVTIVVRQGYTDQTFAADNLPAATLRALKVDDASQLFLEVIAGKADVALADVEQAKAFASAHSTQVDLRFSDPAPAYIPAGLMLKQGDFVFYNFLNAALDYAESNAVLARLNRKYGVSSAKPPSAQK